MIWINSTNDIFLAIFIRIFAGSIVLVNLKFLQKFKDLPSNWHSPQVIPHFSHHYSWETRKFATSQKVAINNPIDAGTNKFLPVIDTVFSADTNTSLLKTHTLFSFTDRNSESFSSFKSTYYVTRGITGVPWNHG